MVGIVVLGAGMMSHGLAYDLARFGELEILTIADINYDAAKMIAKKAGKPANAAKLDARDFRQLCNILENYQTAITALPYHFNLAVTKACIKTGVNMVDLGGNTNIVHQQQNLGPEAATENISIIPDLGLAPGMMTILTMGICKQLDEIDTVKIRVGGLPQTPVPPLGYQLTFSPEGLINEYRERCWVIRNFRRMAVDPLAELESIAFPAALGELEAFSTSGGSSTLPATLEGKARELNYKTIRYSGHCEKIRLLSSMGLFDEDFIKVDKFKIRPRDILCQLLLNKLLKNQPDVVLARVTVTGRKANKEYCTIENEIIDYFDPKTQLTAMMRTTAFPTSIVALMITNGQIEEKGVISAENVVDAVQLKKELKKRNVIVKEGIT